MKVKNSKMVLTIETFSSQSHENNKSLSYLKDNATTLDFVDISDESSTVHQRSLAANPENNETYYEISTQDKNKIILLKAFMEEVTGRSFKFNFHQEVSLKTTISGKIENPQKQSANIGRFGLGLAYIAIKKYKEKQKMTFSSEVIVLTQDRQTIHIDIELNMSRKFVKENNIEIKAGDALADPIVISYDGNATDLTQKKYVFDLDSDGIGDEISFVKSGSGLLSLDFDEDGLASNSTGMSGRNAQYGFSKLSGYDADGNGWIDENDDIYDKLRIWVKDENGNDELFALGQKGVGAIYLGNVESEFSIKDTENNLLGQIRSSSIFLSDDGDVGIVHQIDLAAN